jgi:peptide methionine sulfoxide reductase MsrA
MTKSFILDCVFILYTMIIRLGNHSEAVDIWFDPTVLSYRKILDTFWKLHDPTQNNSSQYKYDI